MRAADFDDFLELRRFAFERRLQALHRRQQTIGDRQRAGDMDRGRETIVRRLAKIDVIVGVHRRFRAARRAKLFIGAIGDHFIDVHVRLRAGAGLPDDKRKMRVEFAGDDFLRRIDDRLRHIRLDQALFGVDLRRRQFHPRQRVNDVDRHLLTANRKIFFRALCLRAPIGPGRNGDVAEGIAFDTVIFSHCFAHRLRLFAARKVVVRLVAWLCGILWRRSIACGGCPRACGFFRRRRHQFGETIAGAINAAFHRARGAAADFGGFFVGHARRRNENEGFALIERQLLQGRPKILKLHMRLLRVRGDQPGCIFAIGIGCFTTTFAEFAVVNVTQDREKPGGQVRPFLKGIETAPRLDEGFLNEIVCAVRIAAYGDGESAQTGNCRYKVDLRALTARNG